MKFNKLQIYVFMFILLVSISYGDFWNATNLTNSDNFYEQSLALNDITGGLVGLVFIFIVFVVTLIIVNKNTNDILSAMAAAGWIGGFTATVLVPLELIAFWIYQYILLICGLSVALSLLISSRLRG